MPDVSNLLTGLIMNFGFNRFSNRTVTFKVEGISKSIFPIAMLPIEHPHITFSTPSATSIYCMNNTDISGT